MINASIAEAHEQPLRRLGLWAQEARWGVGSRTSPIAPVPFAAKVGAWRSGCLGPAVVCLAGKASATLDEPLFQSTALAAPWEPKPRFRARACHAPDGSVGEAGPPRLPTPTPRRCQRGGKSAPGSAVSSGQCERSVNESSPPAMSAAHGRGVQSGGDSAGKHRRQHPDSCRGRLVAGRRRTARNGQRRSPPRCSRSEDWRSRPRTARHWRRARGGKAGTGFLALPNQRLREVKHVVHRPKRVQRVPHRSSNTVGRRKLADQHIRSLLVCSCWIWDDAKTAGSRRRPP